MGDALGAPVEFHSLEAILGEFGPAGIRDFQPEFGRYGAITDDTQMTLFTAEGLLRAHVRERLTGRSAFTEGVAHAYQRWLITQGVRRQGNQTGLDGWLISHEALFSIRAPGNTCLSALTERVSLEDMGPVRNNSKGCGGIMRVAPVGLYAAARGLSAEWAFTLGTDLSALTHGHPTGQLPGGVLAMVIRELVLGRELQAALPAALALVRQRAACEETLAAMEAAVALAARATPPREALAQLGQGWIAEEALAIALFCALRAENLEEGVIMATNHAGDSDSTASITGNLLGAARGVHEIPDRWLEKVEFRKTLLAMADDLATIEAWDLGAGDPAPAESAYWQTRYPGW